MRHGEFTAWIALRRYRGGPGLHISSRSILRVAMEEDLLSTSGGAVFSVNDPGRGPLVFGIVEW